MINCEHCTKFDLFDEYCHQFEKEQKSDSEEADHCIYFEYRETDDPTVPDEPPGHY